MAKFLMISSRKINDKFWANLGTPKNSIFLHHWILLPIPSSKMHRISHIGGENILIKFFLKIKNNLKLN
jgi:hypothetical protein